MKWNDQLVLRASQLIYRDRQCVSTHHNWVEMKGKCFQFEECEDLSRTAVLRPSHQLGPSAFWILWMKGFNLVVWVVSLDWNWRIINTLWPLALLIAGLTPPTINNWGYLASGTATVQPAITSSLALHPVHLGTHSDQSFVLRKLKKIAGKVSSCEAHNDGRWTVLGQECCWQGQNIPHYKISAHLRWYRMNMEMWGKCKWGGDNRRVWIFT